MELSQGSSEAAANLVPGISAGDSHSDTDSHISFDEDDLPDGICDEYAGAFPGPWSIEDEDKLQELGWEGRSRTDRFWWKRFVPYWTHPNWDPAFEITVDGTKTRASRGERMRPAILPVDEGIARTNYTRRWGINTSVPENENGEARSGLTPNVGVAPMQLDATGPGTTEQWTQGFQTFWFGGYTSQELNDLGVYSQDLGIPASDLPDSDIHRLFDRDKWTQEPVPDHGKNKRKATFQNFDLSYNFGEGERKYDAKENDAVWNALLPSIKLASRIIRSNHPHWRMLLAGIYHMRKVPREKDGRTRAEKQKSDYREYRSLWLNIDRNEMYPSARRLFDLRFEAARATLGILTSEGKLKWSVVEGVPNHNGLAMWEVDEATCDFSYRLCLSVNFVWPLLVDQYTESEKAGYQVMLARIMLHELAVSASAELHSVLLTHSNI
ncbi:hypothetical protein KVR01_000472 [Diaporthe batatas]|uniref:uncharacterized protein n=1 Tax=Diaporthe batatas TaxID=748121 RepID=UPI001D044010|nr:uncharacterized protein KVR01_000472 [Diaporthe batatas]KAG8169727.1 hypothetical protein KVR01_000472 [Diaporthe batatas]